MSLLVMIIFVKIGHLIKGFIILSIKTVLFRFSTGKTNYMTKNNKNGGRGPYHGQALEAICYQAIG